MYKHFSKFMRHLHCYWMNVILMIPPSATRDIYDKSRLYLSTMKITHGSGISSMQQNAF